MTDRILHFSLGPVQGYVGQARRTRDLWVGSFTLSLFAGCAMVALVRAGGKIEFPETVGDELFEMIGDYVDGNTVTKTPYVGSLPNRFKAVVTNVNGNAGEICKRAILSQWEKIEQAVWHQFVHPVVRLNQGKNTDEIWKRQVSNFWEMYWMEGDDPEDGSDGTWLDQRKNLRSHYPVAPYSEGGDHCQLMGEFQEISGYCRVGDKNRQDEFWNTLREQRYNPFGNEFGARVGRLNIEEDEYLCSIAVVKRLFPLLDNLEEVIGWRPGEKDTAGQNSGSLALNIINWPSVSYIAAVPWLKKVSEKVSDQELDNYVKVVRDNEKNAGGVFGETATRIFNFPDRRFYKLDGQLFHQDAIAAWEPEDFKGGTPDERKKSRHNIRESLNKFCRNLGENSGLRASEFYSILLMDGDKIGMLLRADADIVKSGLSLFTRKVKEHFTSGNPDNGTLIYAGGDDVLAFVPIDTAINAAQAMRVAYKVSFEEAIKTSNKPGLELSDVTMSAAIVCAQYKIPLSAVLKQAHEYLDDIAKEKNGRDSLAIAVLKPGGIAFDWVSCWEEDYYPVDDLKNLARELHFDPDFSSSFFHNIRTRYKPLFDYPSEEHESVEFLNPDLVKAFLKAESIKGKSDQNNRTPQINIDKLVSIGLPLKRNKEGVRIPVKLYCFDSGLVAQFFARETKW